MLNLNLNLNLNPSLNLNLHPSLNYFTFVFTLSKWTLVDFTLGFKT